MDFLTCMFGELWGHFTRSQSQGKPQDSRFKNDKKAGCKAMLAPSWKALSGNGSEQAQMRGTTPSSSQGGFQFQRKVHAGRLEYTHFNMPSMERRTDPGKHVQAEIAGRLFESFIVKSCVATQDLKVLYVEVHSVSTEERVRRVWHFKSDACTHCMERGRVAQTVFTLHYIQASD